MRRLSSSGSYSSLSDLSTSPVPIRTSSCSETDCSWLFFSRAGRPGDSPKLVAGEGPHEHRFRVPLSRRDWVDGLYRQRGPYLSGGASAFSGGGFPLRLGRGKRGGGRLDG